MTKSIKDTLTVSLVQTSLVWENPSANLDLLSRKIAKINNHPDLVFLPEMFATGFTMNPKEFAVRMDGPEIMWMQSIASSLEAVVMGSLAIINEEANYVNRLIAMGPEGILALYDKRHLFRHGKEHLHYYAGAERVIFNYQGWRILLQTCYDLRFPVWMRNQNDYDLIALVANWPEVRNYAWRNLLVARAIENQSYVVGVNRVGPDGKGVPHSGDSRIIDPAGKILADLPPNADEILSATISLEELRQCRKSFPVDLDKDRFSFD